MEVINVSGKYVTTLNTRPLMYYETKVIAALLISGFSEKEIKKKVLEDNILQLPSLDRRGRFYSEIVKRLSYLDDYLLGQFDESDPLTAKALLMYTILKKDQLFYEWMKEVVFDKFLIMETTLSKKETDYFFELKSEQSDTIKKWENGTKIRLRDAYHQVLNDIGMLVEIEDNDYLQPIIIDQLVRDYLVENKEKQVIEVMLGEFLE